MMGKPTTIVDFFKTKNAQSSEANVGDASSPTSDIPISFAYILLTLIDTNFIFYMLILSSILIYLLFIFSFFLVNNQSTSNKTNTQTVCFSEDKNN
jgi:hypothetical protein